MTQQSLDRCHMVWQNCLSMIKAEISEQSFKTWFEPIKAVKLLNNVLTIQLPNSFYYEWLEEYYVYLLKKAIDKQLGVGSKLEYIIMVKKPKAKSQSALSSDLSKRNSHTTNDGSQPSVIRHSPKTAITSTKQQKKYPLPTNAIKQKESFCEFTEILLDTRLTFDTFIEGKCNRLARSAGLAIADRPGITAFNPLVVYGGVGLGKTHLAQAIGNSIREQHPKKNIIYVSTEQFTIQFIEASLSNRIKEFTNRYLQVDVLIIDDIQFLAKKEKTQENFFHIFNTLHQRRKQIIMTSDCVPRDMKGLKERLLSRFKWGLTTDLQAPDYQTRAAIIRHKILAEQIHMPDQVVDYLAEQVNSNVRELEGAFISLVANASLMKKDISLNIAKTILSDVVSRSSRQVSIDFIQQGICAYFNVSSEILKSKTRKKNIAFARQIAMYCCKQYTNSSLKAIAEKFGAGNHSTVSHAVKAVEEKLSSDSVYSKTVNNLLTDLQLTKNN